jgi:hypothetical protein
MASRYEKTQKLTNKTGRELPNLCFAAIIVTGKIDAFESTRFCACL